MSATRPNVVVIGGSYVGMRTAQLLASQVSKTHNTVVIEKNSHFQHIFAFPRIGVVPGFEQKAFIPFTNAFHDAPENSTTTIHGVAKDILPDRVVMSDGQIIPYEYLVLATGTGPRGPLLPRTKQEGVTFTRHVQRQVAAAKHITIIGGGAFGVQLACDIREYFPDKRVTVIHSRDHLMNRFHPALHDVVMKRFKELDIDTILGERVSIPAEGFPHDVSDFEVVLSNGKKQPTNLVLTAIGQLPLSSTLQSLSPSSINQDGFVDVLPTMQIKDPKYPNVFAVGDIAATGAAKAARPGSAQAKVVVDNIEALIEGNTTDLEEYKADRPGIHLLLGLNSGVKFRNPEEGQEPWVLHEDTGRLEVGCDRKWSQLAPGVTDYTL